MSSSSESCPFLPAALEVAPYGATGAIGGTIDNSPSVRVDVLDEHVARRSQSDIDVTPLVHAAARAVGVLEADCHLGDALSESADRLSTWARNESSTAIFLARICTCMPYSFQVIPIGWALD